MSAPEFGRGSPDLIDDKYLGTGRAGLSSRTDGLIRHYREHGPAESFREALEHYASCVEGAIGWFLGPSNDQVSALCSDAIAPGSVVQELARELGPWSPRDNSQFRRWLESIASDLDGIRRQLMRTAASPFDNAQIEGLSGAVYRLSRRMRRVSCLVVVSGGSAGAVRIGSSVYECVESRPLLRAESVLSSMSQNGPAAFSAECVASVESDLRRMSETLRDPSMRSTDLRSVFQS